MLISGSFNVERYLLAGFRAASLQLCKRFVISIQAILREDRTLRFLHYWIVPPLFKVGSELIKAVNIDSQETIFTAGEDEDEREAREERILDYKGGVNTIALCLDGLGKKYGLEVKETALSFSDLATQAGILQDQFAATTSG
jgi:hypothetical protein